MALGRDRGRLRAVRREFCSFSSPFLCVNYNPNYHSEFRLHKSKKTDFLFVSHSSFKTELSKSQKFLDTGIFLILVNKLLTLLTMPCLLINCRFLLQAPKMKPLLLTVIVLAADHIPIGWPHTITILRIVSAVQELLLPLRRLGDGVNRLLLFLSSSHVLILWGLVLDLILKIVLNHFIAAVYDSNKLISNCLFFLSITVHLFLLGHNRLVLGTQLGSDFVDFFLLQLLKLGFEFFLLPAEARLHILQSLVEHADEPGQPVDIVGVGNELVDELLEAGHAAPGQIKINIIKSIGLYDLYLQKCFTTVKLLPTIRLTMPEFIIQSDRHPQLPYYKQPYPTLQQPNPSMLDPQTSTTLPTSLPSKTNPMQTPHNIHSNSQLLSIIAQSHPQQQANLNKYYLKDCQKYMRYGRYLLVRVEGEVLYMSGNARVVHFGELEQRAQWGQRGEQRELSQQQGQGGARIGVGLGLNERDMNQGQVSSLEISCKGLSLDIQDLKSKLKTYTDMLKQPRSAAKPHPQQPSAIPSEQQPHTQKDSSEYLRHGSIATSKDDTKGEHYEVKSHQNVSQFVDVSPVRKAHKTKTIFVRKN